MSDLAAESPVDDQHVDDEQAAETYRDDSEDELLTHRPYLADPVAPEPIAVQPHVPESTESEPPVPGPTVPEPAAEPEPELFTHRSFGHEPFEAEPAGAESPAVSAASTQSATEPDAVRTRETAAESVLESTAPFTPVRLADLLGSAERHAEPKPVRHDPAAAARAPRAGRSLRPRRSVSGRSAALAAFVLALGMAGVALIATQTGVVSVAPTVDSVLPTTGMAVAPPPVAGPGVPNLVPPPAKPTPASTPALTPAVPTPALTPAVPPTPGGARSSTRAGSGTTPRTGIPAIRTGGARPPAARPPGSRRVPDRLVEHDEPEDVSNDSNDTNDSDDDSSSRRSHSTRSRPGLLGGLLGGLL